MKLTEDTKKSLAQEFRETMQRQIDRDLSLLPMRKVRQTIVSSGIMHYCVPLVDYPKMACCPIDSPCPAHAKHLKRGRK
jgi:hypothetical protein